MSDVTPAETAADVIAETLRGNVPLAECILSDLAAAGFAVVQLPKAGVQRPVCGGIPAILFMDFDSEMCAYRLDVDDENCVYDGEYRYTAEEATAQAVCLLAAAVSGANKTGAEGREEKPLSDELARMIHNVRDGTALGCIARCKVCGKAIQLRRLNDHSGIGHSFDAWVHMGKANHSAVLNPGVCDVPDEDQHKTLGP